MKLIREDQQTITLSSQEATVATTLSGLLLLGAITLLVLTHIPTTAGLITVSTCLLIFIWTRQFFYNWQLELDQGSAQFCYRKKRLWGSISEEIESFQQLQAIKIESAGEGTSRLIFEFRDKTITPSRVFSSSDKTSLKNQLEDFIAQRVTIH